jgi:predicted nucleic acid-binding Zn ribbon protein
MAGKDLQLEKLAAVLEKSLKRLDLSAKLTEYGVWPIWDGIVGETIARNAQPEKIRHGTLFIKVASSTWMQQLQFMKEMIAERLNQKLGREVVKNIFFVVGKVDWTPREAPKKKRPASAPSPAEPTADEVELQSIKDPELRRALKRLLAAATRKASREGSE